MRQCFTFVLVTLACGCNVTVEEIPVTAPIVPASETDYLDEFVFYPRQNDDNVPAQDDVTETLKKTIAAQELQLNQYRGREQVLLKLLQMQDNALRKEILRRLSPVGTNARHAKVEEQSEALEIIDQIEREQIAPYFHEIYYDESIEFLVGTIGSMSYILDRAGLPITPGYHTISLRKGEVWGTYGSFEECVINRRDNITSTGDSLYDFPVGR